MDEARNDDRLRLWYDAPATHWNEALPLGNGRLGAMVFGDARGCRIHLNEDTLYSGEPHRVAKPPTIAEDIEHVSTLIRTVKLQEAQAQWFSPAPTMTMDRPWVFSAYDAGMGEFGPGRPVELQNSIDLAHKMIRRHHIVEIELIEKLALSVLSTTHHGPFPLLPFLRKTESRSGQSLNESFATRSPRLRTFLAGSQ